MLAALALSRHALRDLLNPLPLEGKEGAVKRMTSYIAHALREPWSQAQRHRLRSTDDDQ